jgi:hypothetical protein
MELLAEVRSARSIRSAIFACLSCLLCLGFVLAGGAADASTGNGAGGGVHVRHIHPHVIARKLGPIRQAPVAPVLRNVRQVRVPAGGGHISRSRPPLIPGNTPMRLAHTGREQARTPSADTCNFASSTTPTTSNCWSGYVEQGTSYYTVSADWNVPDVVTQGTGDYADATWIGIGGWGTSGPLQAGTEEDSINGTLYYYIWDENLPGQTTEQYRFNVSPGDHISAQIWLSGPSTWSISVTDDTTGQTDSQTESYTGSTASAEFIQEAPTSGGNVLPMNQYSQFGFYNAAANYTWNGLSSSQEVTMSGTSVPSGPNVAASSFNTEYGGAAPSAPEDFEAAFSSNSSTLPGLWTNGIQGTGHTGLAFMSGTSPSATAVSGGYELAFQGSDGNVWTTGTLGLTDWHLGEASGTSPSIAPISGGYEAAFQGSNGDLWTTGTSGSTDWGLGMMAGTSPSITAVSGGVEIAFQANTGDLWTVGSAGNTGWPLAMTGSPSITTLSGGGFEAAVRSSGGTLITIDNTGSGTNWTSYALASGTSPSITTLSGGGFESALQSSGGSLITVDNTGSGTNWTNVILAGSTSPSITTLSGGGFESAVHGNGGTLFTLDNAGNGINWELGMATGTSPGITALP